MYANNLDLFDHQQAHLDTALGMVVTAIETAADTVVAIA